MLVDLNAQAEHAPKDNRPADRPCGSVEFPLRPSQLPQLMPQPIGAYVPFKPFVEFVLALVLLILLAPLMALTALLVRLTSSGPAVYVQSRVGKGGRLFRIYKIRTMHHNCERISGARWSAPGDPRITTLGRFLRKAHLDELPQLINVLKGDMSLVGPRPERPEFVAALEREIPRYSERLAVRPGVTGLAQVYLPPDTDMESVRRKLAYDLFYIAHIGPWLDFRLLLCTGLQMLAVPFPVAHWLFRMPSERIVEGAALVQSPLAAPSPDLQLS